MYHTVPVPNLVIWDVEGTSIESTDSTGPAWGLEWWEVGGKMGGG